ncbi:hypothetical protein [Leclercia adecarboxylata]|uniref:hypothetical protein n=1 Tax=Leclercia adecarboxylata TaxID=83655 RepID=UPI0020268841|nr:hypothetical protein [Leclercia adecarboxylata]URM24034.1 hypothetical protein JJN11_05790 [Leclercia adecarboxylata]
MTTEQFAYWLQGFCEIHGAPPSAEQWEMIKEHLQTCFVKITGAGSEKTIQQGLPQFTADLPDWFKRTHTPVNTGMPYTVTC